MRLQFAIDLPERKPHRTHFGADMHQFVLFVYQPRCLAHYLVNLYNNLINTTAACTPPPVNIANCSRCGERKKGAGTSGVQVRFKLESS